MLCLLVRTVPADGNFFLAVMVRGRVKTVVAVRYRTVPVNLVHSRSPHVLCAVGV